MAAALSRENVEFVRFNEVSVRSQFEQNDQNDARHSTLRILRFRLRQVIESNDSCEARNDQRIARETNTDSVRCEADLSYQNALHLEGQN